MTNSPTTSEVEEKEMPKGLKIFLLSIGFLISAAILFFTIDLGSVEEFMDTETVKHAALLLSLTALVIIGFNLYRAILGHNEHANKHAEEILLAGVHFNYPALVLFPDRYLKGVEIDSKEAKQFHNYYIMGLVMLSVLIMTALVPSFSLLANGAQSMSIDGYDENGQPYNNVASGLFATAYVLRWVVVIFWAASLSFGMKEVSQGHKALILINGKILRRVNAGSGVVLTFPFLFKSIRLWQVKSEIIVDTVLRTNLLTASAQSAVYEPGWDDRLRPSADGISERVRFFKDIFHINRRFIKTLEMKGIFSLGDQVTFYEKKYSMEEVESNLKAMMESGQLETFSKKTYAQSIGSIEVVQNRMKEIMTRELKAYDNCIGVKNIPITNIDFDRKIEPVDIAETMIKVRAVKAAA